MVEGARLESVYTGNRIAGSNPASSAICAELRLTAMLYERARSGRPFGESLDGALSNHQVASHRDRSSGFGNPPAWTTLPSITIPGVDAMP